MSEILQWSPSFTKQQLAHLTRLATTFALAHGLLYLPESPPAIPTSAIHAPLSLVPTPYPRRLFELSQQLQSLYNVLYARIAMDEDFLDEVMGAEKGAGLVDHFTRELWNAWKISQKDCAQPVQLGLFRSDYLLHIEPSDVSKRVQLKQVEFNTISSSFGALSDIASSMHKYLHKVTGYYDISPVLDEKKLPPNNATKGLALGIAMAHREYRDDQAKVLFVVQDPERNVFDQRWLEYELINSISVVRQTMDELLISASLSPLDNTLVIEEDGLRHKISVIYFRATYTPKDLPSVAHWKLRTLLERSRAIKCPSLPLQLAGGKKVQQVLTRPGILEKFLFDIPSEQVAEIRETWVALWGLDEPETSVADSGVNRAYRSYQGLVLKPQREGGGNNIYKGHIPSFLDQLPIEERKAWIAMELIRPPHEISNYMVRAGGGAGAVKGPIASELGIYGWALFGHGREIEQGKAGWLLRTKSTESDEGGVAVGFSVLDSPVLVD